MKSHRLIFIDLLRGLAVVWMIETHVLHVGLAAMWKAGKVFDFLHHSNAYVATIFLFCAGAGFWLAAEKKWSDYKTFSPPFWAALRRLGFILAVAYWLDLPYFSLQKILLHRPESLEALATCDILHVIVISSLVAFLLLFLSPSLKILQLLLAGAALAVYFLAPVIWSHSPFPALPIFIRGFFPAPILAKFPLFPWMGHFFAGAFFTALLFRSKRPKLLAVLLCLGALLAPSLIFYIKELPWTYGDPNYWWYGSSGNAFLRLSRAVLLYSSLFLLEEKNRLLPRVTRFFQGLGQESLFMYVGHVMFLYGTIVNWGLRTLVPSGFPPWGALAVFIFLVFGGYKTAMVWQRHKESYPRQVRFFMALAAVGFALLSIITPSDFFNGLFSFVPILK